ncbi:MAG: helix-turn-helix domain-containing protein [Ruminococcaceae bacterium]|nr:helix-turn-helix domain-containing protein [Oscillospiraceae bacterium]
MEYKSVALTDDIIIRDIYTIYYFEYTKDYTFRGEKHNFWEMLYVDKGEAIVTADDKDLLLRQGDIVFHKPNEWHNVRANNKVAPNFFIMTFSSKSKAMKLFENKVFTISDTQKSLLSKILDESTKIFENDLSKQYDHLKKRKSIPFGTQQLVKLYLTEFLISLVRKDESKTRLTLKHYTENNIFNTITDFMHNNISSKITFNDIIQYANLSASTIKKLFKDTVNMGAIDYFIKLKIDYAKKYIREGEYNMSQIASMLGYDNIHYFSKQFKIHTDMSPTEYAKTIKSKSSEIKEKKE